MICLLLYVDLHSWYWLYFLYTVHLGPSFTFTSHHVTLRGSYIPRDCAVSVAISWQYILCHHMAASFMYRIMVVNGDVTKDPTVYEADVLQLYCVSSDEKRLRICWVCPCRTWSRWRTAPVSWMWMRRLLCAVQQLLQYVELHSQDLTDLSRVRDYSERDGKLRGCFRHQFWKNKLTLARRNEWGWASNQHTLIWLSRLFGSIILTYLTPNVIQQKWFKKRF